MTCWSCHHYRGNACARAMAVFPNGTPESCIEFRYEPGSDEAEMLEDCAERDWFSDEASE